MSWFFAEGGAQKGPVGDDQFADLVRGGTISADTLVWREGMPNWSRYGDLPPAGAPPLPGAAPDAEAGPDAAPCVECRRIFPRKDMVAYAGAHVCAECRDHFFQKVREGVVQPATVAGALPLAGFGTRWLAKIIDYIILVVLQSLVSVPLAVGMGLTAGNVEPGDTTFLLAFVALQLLVFALQMGIELGFKTFFYGRFAATPGKMALNIKVVRADGSRLGYGRSLGRAGAEILNALTFFIGYLMAAFDEERRGLHDRLCDTRVIKAS